MAVRLPERAFYTLRDLTDCWEVSVTDLQEWLINGELNASVMLPLMSVYEVEQHVVANRQRITPILRHWEGYAAISRHYCTRLFKYNYIHLRSFNCAETNASLSLPETAQDIQISSKELLILRAERLRFEKRYGYSHNFSGRSVQSSERENGVPSYAGISADPSFRIVYLNGKECRFGEKQSSVLRLLHKASLSDEPWKHGKLLLQQAGSQSFTLSNIFKRKPVWRELVISDGRGNYRLIDTIRTR